MLLLSCCHGKNASITSSTCLANNVEESQQLLEQDMDLFGVSSNSSSSSSTTHLCLMAKEFKVSPTVHSNISHDDDDDDVDDDTSLEIKQEIIAFDHFMTNLQGVGKKHFGSLMSRIGELEDVLELKGEIEREDAYEKVSLQSSLEDEQETNAHLQEQLETIMESHNSKIAKLTKDRDLYFAKCKIVQNEKTKFVAAHAS